VSAASPADWAAAGSAGVGALGLICLAMAFVDADPADLDPRPAVRRAAVAAHQGAVHAGHDLAWVTASARHHAVPLLAALRVAPRDAALSLAALLVLLLPATGGTR
jgi:hypothetical protein